MLKNLLLRCSVQQLSLSAEASGPSRRAAEQEAATITMPLVKEN